MAKDVTVTNGLKCQTFLTCGNPKPDTWQDSLHRRAKLRLIKVTSPNPNPNPNPSRNPNPTFKTLNPSPKVTGVQKRAIQPYLLTFSWYRLWASSNRGYQGSRTCSRDSRSWTWLFGLHWVFCQCLLLFSIVESSLLTYWPDFWPRRACKRKTAS